MRLLGGLHSPQMDRLSSLGYVGCCQEGSASVSPGAACSVLLEEYVQGLETPLLVPSCPPNLPHPLCVHLWLDRAGMWEALLGQLYAWQSPLHTDCWVAVPIPRATEVTLSTQTG